MNPDLMTPQMFIDFVKELNTIAPLHSVSALGYTVQFVVAPDPALPTAINGLMKAVTGRNLHAVE